jgi:ribosomal-protein-alanine N-acetyltransferase
MPLILREFRREDFDTLWRIDQQCFAPGIAYSKAELAAYIRRRGSFTVVAESTRATQSDSAENTVPGLDNSVEAEVEAEVGAEVEAEVDGKVVGFIIAEASRRGIGHIISIDVLPPARRSGAGSQLLKAAEGRLRVAGCNVVSLEAAVDNEAALAFYKRHGYDVLKVIPGYYSDGLDALALEKEI